MPSLYGTDLSVNALKARESSRFGTRPLAFYTFMCDTTTGFAANWQESNSLYSRVVQALQESGVELYWLGQPQSLSSPFSGTDAFTFAINDDADNPQKYLEDTYTYTVLGANQDGYNNYLKLDVASPDLLNIGQPVVFNMTDDGVVAGKTYYIHSYDFNNDATYIRLSETVSQRNTDGAPDYPQGLGHPGPIFQLNPVPTTDQYTAKLYVYDTYWSGTAGDVQWACCWDPDNKVINAWNLDQSVGNLLQGAVGSFYIYRDSVQAFGISPIFGCCC
jgi:hypothetical protein